MIGIINHPLTQALVVTRHCDSNRCALLDNQWKQQQHEADEQGEQQEVDKNDPRYPGESAPMQPGYDRPDHRTHHDGDKQGENDLVKAIEKPEAKGDKNEDESRPHDAPKCPSIRL